MVRQTVTLHFDEDVRVLYVAGDAQLSIVNAFVIFGVGFHSTNSSRTVHFASALHLSAYVCR